MKRRRVFFHVQHLLGIGHLKRAATLSRALAEAGFEVTLASGGPRVPELNFGEADLAVKVIQLPAASAADASFRTLIDNDGNPITEAWKRRRAEVLLEAWRAAHADVLLVELFPFGRRALRFELLPLLQAARDALVVCSVRDVLQAKPAKETETLELLERFFDRVLVHGDPRVIGFERSFAPAARIADRLHYSGYVVDPLPGVSSAAGKGEVIVSAGGGAVGRYLLEAALRARPSSALRSRTWRVLAGINAAPGDLEALQAMAGAGVVVERSRADFTTLLANCELSVSQAGYNTVMEILQAGARAVAVPFSGGNESEQALRARLLAERGLLEVVEEHALSPESLAAAVDRAAGGSRPPAGAVDLGGARRSAELLDEWTR
ncbi:MAG TPA: glycosyltransferase [Burkholderiales bacterium]|nr:glycosyltransferase [Burkholderiales bacterium]